MRLDRLEAPDAVFHVRFGFDEDVIVGAALEPAALGIEDHAPPARSFVPFSKGRMARLRKSGFDVQVEDAILKIYGHNRALGERRRIVVHGQILDRDPFAARHGKNAGRRIGDDDLGLSRLATNDQTLGSVDPEAALPGIRRVNAVRAGSQHDFGAGAGLDGGGDGLADGLARVRVAVGCGTEVFGSKDLGTRLAGHCRGNRKAPKHNGAEPRGSKGW